VRIEKCGEHVLNSKSEYNHCRVPRLQIDMEGWRAGKERERKKKEEREKKEKSDVRPEPERPDPEWLDVLDVQGEVELEEVETESRRLENKRKAEEDEDNTNKKKRKEKKQKFERLTNWGENFSIHKEGYDHQHEGLHGIEDWLIEKAVEEETRTRDWLLEESSRPAHAKLRQEVSRTVLKAGKSKLDEKVKKVSFKYNKTGLLTAKERSEINRTSSNIFD
jgi:hypothetical protein